MGTNKTEVKSLGRKLRGADNWSDPVATVAQLPSPSDALPGSVCYVYADPDSAQIGVYVLRSGSWVNTWGQTGEGSIAAYTQVVPAPSTDALQPAFDNLPGSGGTIFLKNGVHTLTSLVTAAGKTRLRIMGEGPGSILVVELGVLAGSDADLLSVFEMSNLTIVTDDPDATRDFALGLSLAAGGIARISDCYFSGSYFKAVKLLAAINALGYDVVFGYLRVLASGKAPAIKANKYMSTSEFKGHDLITIGSTEGFFAFQFGAGKAAKLVAASDNDGPEAVVKALSALSGK